MNIDDALAHPLAETSPRDDLPWRDNAYLAFWTADGRVLGVVHVSTSPNAEGRRARASVSVRGEVVEVIEELERGTFASESIEFDVEGHRIAVEHPDLTMTLEMAPSLAVADYSTSQVIPPLDPAHPLQHYQQRSIVKGEVSLGKGDASTTTFEGSGLRDRTWGFRNESASIAEYVAVMIDSRDTFLTAMKFRGVDGSVRLDGFLLSEGYAKPIDQFEITRDGAGLVSRFDVGMSGETSRYTRTALLGGFWVPMGVERTGPTFSAYDEFMRTNSGIGVVEQGILRTLF